MPIVTAPPIPEKPVHAFTVEDIGALLGPSPASGVEDATGAAWWPGLRHAEPGNRCVSCGAGPTASVGPAPHAGVVKPTTAGT